MEMGLPMEFGDFQGKQLRPHVCIIGGGLAGLSSGLVLAKRGVRVTLLEKKSYPFHRVCGEYISNEVLPFLKSLNLSPENWGSASIENLEITSVQGGKLSQKLDLGGFGLSRFALDQILFQALESSGALVFTSCKVNDVRFEKNQFIIHDAQGRNFIADFVIGAFGKRSNLDANLQRPFFKKRSPFIGIKYHVLWDMPRNLIQLHNFHLGYAGISAIESNLFCFCYLSHLSNLKNHQNIQEMEHIVLKKNPYLKNILNQAEFLWDKPLVIHEVSFEPKEPVLSHILMVGDSAGLISPLCGNGMAMAIQSGKLAADCILEWGYPLPNRVNRDTFEKSYARNWSNLFKKRLWVGRQIQKIFGNDLLTHSTLSLLKVTPQLTQKIIKSTHGEVF